MKMIFLPDRKCLSSFASWPPLLILMLFVFASFTFKQFLEQYGLSLFRLCYATWPLNFTVLVISILVIWAFKLNIEYSQLMNRAVLILSTRIRKKRGINKTSTREIHLIFISSRVLSQVTSSGTRKRSRQNKSLSVLN